MSENTTKGYRRFGTVDSIFNGIPSVHLTVPDELQLTDTMSSKLLNPEKSKVFRAEPESSDSSSEDEISRNISFGEEDFSWPVDKFHNTCLKRILAPEKLELCPTKDSTETANKFRKLPLKRISGQSKSNSRTMNCPKNVNDRFITYDPYLQRQRSSEKYSFMDLQELEMHGNSKLLNILPNEAAKLELQNSFISAQRRHYLNH